MKILQVCPRYYPDIGGVEEHVRNIGERLVKKCDVSVFATDPSGKLPKEEMINGVYVRRFKSWAPNEAYYFSGELKRYLMKNSDSFDIVHAHSYHAFPALYAAEAKGRNRFVFTPHYLGSGETFIRNLLHKPYRLIGRSIFIKADRTICVSDYEKKLVMEHFGIENKRILVIPNGVDLNELSGYRSHIKNTARSMFGQVKIAYSGRLERKQKNVDKLVRSVKILVDDYGVDAKLVIIGRGPYEHDMKQLIRRIGLQDRVEHKWWLPRSEYIRELATSNLYVMPSEHECYGIATAEVIALGVPCVVANSTALQEFVNNNLAFGIDPPITPERIASVVRKALISPPGRNQSKADRMIVSWDDVVCQLIDRVYGRIVG
jgi:glycosyltransferase involved in cell wall biosynthesis